MAPVDGPAVGEAIAGYWPDDGTWLAASVTEGPHDDGSFTVCWDEDGSCSYLVPEFIRQLEQLIEEPDETAPKRQKTDGVAALPKKTPEAETPAPVSKAVVGEFTGTVTRLDQSGYCVKCPEVFKKYRRDAKISPQNMPKGIAIGNVVSFSISPPPTDSAAPVAKNISLAVSLAAKAASASEDKKPLVQPQPEDLLRMVGLVRFKSQSTGRYFIFCQDISDVCGKDAQVPKEEMPSGGLQIGDKVTFDAEEPGEETPFAFNVRVVARADGKPLEPANVEPEESEEEMELDVGNAEAEEEENLSDAEEWPEGGTVDVVKPLPKTKHSLVSQPKASAPKREPPKDPDTTEGWIAKQNELFGHLPKLARGWIRIRSQSKGLLYYYNIENGESSGEEPRK